MELQTIKARNENRVNVSINPLIRIRGKYFLYIKKHFSIHFPAENAINWINDNLEFLNLPFNIKEINTKNATAFLSEEINFNQCVGYDKIPFKGVYVIGIEWPVGTKKELGRKAKSKRGKKSQNKLFVSSKDLYDLQ